MQDPNPDLVIADFFHRLNDRFGRPLHIRLHQNRQFGDIFICFGFCQKLIQCHTCTGSGLLILGDFGTIIGDLAGFALIRNHMQDITGLWRAVQAENLDRDGRHRLFDPLTLVIDQRADLAPLLAHNKDIAGLQCAFLHQNRGNRATSGIQLCLDHGALGLAIRIRSQLQQFRLQNDGFQQLVQTGAIDGRNLNVQHIARHFFNDDLMLKQLGPHLVRIGARPVNLVDRHNERHFGSLGVVDGLDRLRHDAVIGGNNQNNDIRYLGTTGAHRCKCRVAGRIQEGQDRAIDIDLIGADMLRNAASLARDDVGFSDGIQNRRFAVIHVPHDRDHRRTRLQRVRIVFLGDDDIFDIGRRNPDRLVTEFLDDQFRRIRVDRLVLRRHDTVCHQRFDHIGNTLGHPVGKFLNHDGFRKLDLAHDFFAHLIAALHLALVAFLTAFHRRKRPLAAVFAGQRPRNGQFAGTAAVVVIARGAALLVLIRVIAGVTLFARGCRASCRAGLAVGRSRRSRCRRHLVLAWRARFFGRWLFRRFGFGLFAGFFLGFLALCGFDGLAFLGLFCGAQGLTLCFATRGLFGLTGTAFRFGCLRRLQGTHTAFHFRIGRTGAGGPLTTACTGAIAACTACTGLWNNHPLAFGFHHHRFRPPMGKTLLHAAGFGSAAQAKLAAFGVTALGVTHARSNLSIHRHAVMRI